MPSFYQAISDLDVDMEKTYQDWLEERFGSDGCLDEEARKAFLDNEDGWQDGNWFEYTDHSDYWHEFPVRYFDEVYDLASEGGLVDVCCRWSVPSVFCAYFLEQINREQIEKNVRDKIREENKRVVKVIHPWTIFDKPQVHLSDEAVQNIMSFI